MGRAQSPQGIALCAQRAQQHPRPANALRVARGHLAAEMCQQKTRRYDSGECCQRKAAEIGRKARSLPLKLWMTPVDEKRSIIC